MFRLCAFLFRVGYLVAVLVALVFLVPRFSDSVRAAFTPNPFGDETLESFAIPVALLVGFIAPAVLAILRIARRRELVSDASLREAPILAVLVFGASVLGSSLFLLVAWIVISTTPAERHGANLAAPVVLGLLLLAFALLTGECVLAPGGDRRDGAS